MILARSAGKKVSQTSSTKLRQLNFSIFRFRSVAASQHHWPLNNKSDWVIESVFCKMTRVTRIASDQQSTTKQQPLIIWVYELVSIVLPFLDFVVIVFKWSNFLKPACSWYMSERGEVSQPAGPLWGSLSVRHHSRSPCNSLQNIDPAFQASRGRELSLPGNPPRPPPGRNTTAPTAPWHAGSNSLILLINVNCVVAVHTLICQNRQKIFFIFF